MTGDASEVRRFALLFGEPLTDRATGEIAERLKCERVTHILTRAPKVPRAQREL